MAAAKHCPYLRYRHKTNLRAEGASGHNSRLDWAIGGSPLPAGLTTLAGFPERVEPASGFAFPSQS